MLFDQPLIDESVMIKHMTAEERTIANAALNTGPWDNHDQIVTVVADQLGRSNLGVWKKPCNSSGYGWF